MGSDVRLTRSRPRPPGGFELFSWFFMRLSGLALIFLALGHLTVMHLINSIENVNYQFVVGRYATPFWRSYDMLMLVLALLHGCNGLRTVIEDYLHRPALRVAALSLLYSAVVFFLVVGGIIIVTFQPGAVAK